MGMRITPSNVTSDNMLQNAYPIFRDCYASYKIVLNKRYILFLIVIIAIGRDTIKE